jgi:hypothetical protein
MKDKEAGFLHNEAISTARPFMLHPMKKQGYPKNLCTYILDELSRASVVI